MKTALLLSGGMDSLCLAWWKRPEIGVTLDYGQLPAQAEIEASTAICHRLGIEHHILRVDCRAFGSGDMAGNAPDLNAPATDWWPYRNQMLVTLAAMKVISLRVACLYIGTVKSDGSHVDGTEEFVKSLSDLLRLQEGALSLEAPAIRMTTTELVKRSGVPRGTLAFAHSCHKSNIPCGACRGCNKYVEVYSELQDDLD